MFLSFSHSLLPPQHMFSQHSHVPFFLYFPKSCLSLSLLNLDCGTFRHATLSTSAILSPENLIEGWVYILNPLILKLHTVFSASSVTNMFCSTLGKLLNAIFPKMRSILNDFDEVTGKKHTLKIVGGSLKILAHQ